MSSTYTGRYGSHRIPRFSVSFRLTFQSSSKNNDGAILVVQLSSTVVSFTLTGNPR